MAYEQLPLDTDYDTLLARAVGRIKQRIPGYRFDTASLDAAWLEEFLRIEIETRQTVLTRVDTEFDRFGQQEFGIARTPAAPASLDVTITAVDSTGHTIPAGTLAAFPTGDATFAAFTTIADATIDPGQSSVEVTMQAVLSGTAVNGLGPGVMTLMQAPASVASITADTVSSGGVDAETTDAYLSRLVEELQLLTPRPILPADFATLARRVTGVHRAVAIDGYDPDAGTYGHERTVWVGLVDLDGLPVVSDVAEAVQDYLDSLREANFIVRVGPPTYTALTVDFVVIPKAGYDPAVAVLNGVAAATAYLSPATHGGGDQDPPVWTDSPLIRYLELAHQIDDADGVAHVDQLLLNGGTADVVLDGPAGLPAAVDDPDTPTVINGTAA